MDGKEAIIKKILDGADEKSAAVIKEAQMQAAESISAVREALEQNEKIVKTQCDDYITESVQRAKAAAELDVRKYELSLKRQAMSDAEKQAVKKINSLPEKDYVLFIAKLIKKYGEKGESIIVANKDKKIVTAEALGKLCPEMEIKIAGYADFDGGIILTCEKYDKSLTLEQLVSMVAYKKEAEIAKILFG